MRNNEIDAILYAIATVFSETILIAPFIIIEKIIKKTRKKDLKFKYNNYRGEQLPQNEKQNQKQFKKQKISKKTIFLLFLAIGGIFAGAQFLISYGLQTADAITASIAFKSSMIYTIIFGAIFLKEKPSKTQIGLTLMIFVALYYTISEGTFKPLEINLGALILILVPLLWTTGHSITKPILEKKILEPFDVIFLRTSISSIILFIFYFGVLNKPISRFSLIFSSENIVNTFAIGLAYGIGHFFWYLGLRYIDLSINSAIQAPQPIITSIIAAIFLNEVLKIYHLIGIAIIIFSILGILVDKNKRNKII